MAADLPSGEAIVIASAEGYAPSVAVFDIGAGATRVENLRLPAGVVLEGSVLDASGEPVSGVEILFEYQIYSKGTGLMAGLVGARVETDAAGEFALTNLRPNETLLLWAETRQQHHERGDCLPGPRGHPAGCAAVLTGTAHSACPRGSRPARPGRSKTA